MGVAGEHMYALNVVASDFKLYDFICAEFTLLDKAVTADNDEELPLGVVPMLSFCDARLADVYRDLTAVESVHQLGE